MAFVPEHHHESHGAFMNKVTASHLHIASYFQNLNFVENNKIVILICHLGILRVI